MAETREPQGYSGDTCTLLHKAVKMCSIQQLDQLVKSPGIDVNVRDALGRSALHVAAGIGATDAIELLRASGSEPDTQDIFGQTPLHIATLNNQGAALRLLLEMGSDLTVANNDNELPIHIAAGLEINDPPDGSTYSVINILIKHGSPLDHTNKHSFTPLMVSIINKQHVAMEMLLSNNCNTDMMSNKRGAAFHLALEEPNPRAVDLMFIFGADYHQAEPIDLHRSTKPSAIEIIASKTSIRYMKMALVNVGHDLECLEPIMSRVTEFPQQDVMTLVELISIIWPRRQGTGIYKMVDSLKDEHKKAYDYLMALKKQPQSLRDLARIHSREVLSSRYRSVTRGVDVLGDILPQSIKDYLLLEDLLQD